MTIEIELFDGTVLEFPDGTDPAVIDRVAKTETATRQPAGSNATSPANHEATAGMPIMPPAADAQGATRGPQTAGERLDSDLGNIVDWAVGGGQTALDVAGSAGDGLRQGVSAVAGLPVELINAAPMLANILPGEQGVGPLSNRPVGGAADFDELFRFSLPRVTEPLIPDYEPQTAAGRFANRVGEELGATGAMIAGPMGVAARTGVEGARRLAPAARSFVEPLAVNAPKVIGREMGYAGAAGAGAQMANEIVDPAQHEGTWWSDLLGSVGGMGALGAVKAVGSLGRNIYGAATGRTGAFDDVAGRAVADRLIDNSSTMQAQHAARGGEAIDATNLADALSQRSAAERVIPGFRANIADRTVDPGLSTLAYNADTALPGAANARRTANASAVDQVMTDIAPEGNATALREALGGGAQRRIDDANEARRQAQLSWGNAEAAATPMTTPTERGSALRAALADRYSTEQDRISGLYGQIDDTTPADMTELRDRMRGVTENLPVNDADRFLPSEARTAERLAPEQATEPTGLLDMFGSPIMREAEGSTRPINEAMSIRSGLSADIRATDNAQQRRVAGQYLDEVNDFIRSALPEEQARLLDDANAARLDVGRRFEDRGAVPDILRSTGRDQYVMPDEAVPGRALRGETDYKAVLAEAGKDQAARRAVADQLLADAQRSNALRSPEALAQFVRDRNFAFKDFPEARTALEQAGVSKQALNAADEAARQTERTYSPGGPSATGQYLKYDDTQTRAAIGTAWKSAQPERAVRELLEVAGDTAETRAAAKAALWQEVGGSGKLDATTMTSADGVQRWSGRKLKKLFDDPKFAKTAEVLWEDNPEHLQNMREVVDALSKADGSLNAKAPAASGTAQSLAGKYDPSLSTSSIASRARSVQRGQLSPTIAVVDVLSTALRNRSAKVQSRAIDELMTRAVNDPDLAAQLLRRYNPADEAAENRAFLTRFGTRLPTVANIIAGGDDDEDETFNRTMGTQ